MSAASKGHGTGEDDKSIRRRARSGRNCALERARKVRHIGTHTLRVQQAACMKRLEYLKAAGTANPSDLLMKHLAEALKDQHCKTAGLVFVGGRAGKAPEFCK